MSSAECKRIAELIDDYMEHRLAAYERQELESHVSRCLRCAEELRTRPALDRYLRRELVAAVGTLSLPSSRTPRIVAAAQASTRRWAWSRRLLLAGRFSAALLAVLLLLGAVAYSTGRVSLPFVPGGLPLPGLDSPARSLTLSRIEIEPPTLHPGELFTATIFVYNERAVDLPLTRLKLSIDGPQRVYQFVLSSTELVPAGGVAVLQITPAWLADAGEDRYRVLGGNLLDVPGTYTVSLTLFSPSTASER